MELLQNFAFYLASFFVAIFILVSVHEFGHFYVARLCGVKVLRFCIGLGKPVWSYTDKKGTEFGLALLPLGGYVKMFGDGDGEVSEHQKHQSYLHKSVGQRIAILAAGPLANFVLAIFIFWGMLFFKGTLGVAPQIGELKPGSLADKAGLHVGQEIVAIDGVLTPTSMDVIEQLLARIGETGVLDITTRELGSDINYESEVMLDRWMSDAGEPNPMTGLGIRFYHPEIMLGEVSPEGAGYQAGLQAKDIILATDGQKAIYLSDWVDYIKSKPGQNISIDIMRDGEELSLQAVPQASTLESGKTVGLLGIQVTTAPWPQNMVRRQAYGFFESLAASMTKTWDKSVFLLSFLKKLVLTKVSIKTVSGPLGIAQVAGDSAKAGWPYYIDLLALLSITLGVMNLLPIPILDGGHILYCLVEAIKGSPVSERIQSFSYSIGLAILVGVMVTAFYYDILRLL